MVIFTRIFKISKSGAFIIKIYPNKFILNKYLNNSKDLIQFLKEATKKAFLYWTVAEQNQSKPIIESMKMYVENKMNITINDWDQLIQQEAVERLFKNSEIPKEYTRLKNLKHSKLENG